MPSPCYARSMRTALKCITIVAGIILLLAQTTVVFADITTGATTTVAVVPQPPNYQLSLSQSVGPGPISQGTDITYTIVYGAKSSSSFTLNDTLTVNFSQNTLDGVTQVADLVPGSATNAYNGAQPVVDYINKTITWHIIQLPPGTTDQIVTFKLKTNSNYTGTNQVPITVTADFSNQYVSMPQQSVTTTYGFHIYQPTSSSVTPTPTPTPPPSVTPIPTATPLTINAISFSEITPSETTIHIDTSKKTRLSALYGLSQNALFQVYSDTQLASSHDVHLTKLDPQTTYFLKLTATDENGTSISSDILTFKTASSPSPVHVDQQSVILISGNNPLINTNPLLPFAQVLIPHSQIYTVGLRVTKPEHIKSIVALVENAHVLAANTFSSDTTVWSAPMIEQQPGVYIAQLSAPPTPSTYDVFAQIRDTSGNITQTKIAETIVYGPIHIVDANSKKGIEHARIFLSVFDKTKKDYEPILSSELQENPIFTDKDGFAILKNGGGKYKITVSQYGYKTQEVTFTIDKTQLFPPTVTLSSNGFSLLDAGQYYANTANDFSQNLISSLQNLSSAPRFFKLVSIVVLLSFILVTFLLFLIRTKLSLMVIPLFINHNIQKIGSVQGQVFDAITRLPIPLAVIAVSNKATHEVVYTTTSNNKGIFYLKNEWVTSENNLNILAQGYRTNKFAINKDLFPAVIYLHHNLVGGPLHNPIIASFISLAGSLFETVLVASLIFEMFFIPTIGALSICFVVLSLFNLFLWILYQREKILFA